MITNWKKKEKNQRVEMANISNNPCNTEHYKEVSSPKNKLYKVDPDVLKFLKRRNAEEKFKRKFPDEACGKSIRVKIKMPKLSPISDSQYSGKKNDCHIQRCLSTGTFKPRQSGENFILNVPDQKPLYEVSQRSQKPSNQILSKLSHIKGNVHEIIQEVNNVLKGQGHVRFVAVKGSGQVSRVTDEAFVPVPQDSTVLDECCASEEDCLESAEEDLSARQLEEQHLSDITEMGGGTSTKFQETDEGSNEKAVSRMPFKCKRCKTKPFSTQMELDCHMSCHVTQGSDLLVYRCPEPGCPTEKRCYPRMVEHLITQHPTYNNMLQHTQTYRSVAGSFVCAVCSLEFKLKMTLQKHMKKHAPCGGEGAGEEMMVVTNRTCDRCGVRMNNVSLADFNTHRENCRYEYRCSECDYRTGKVKLIETHVKEHTGEREKCQICQKWFASKATLAVHMKKLHSGDWEQNKHQKYVCHICKGEFSRHDALKKHHRRIHEELEKLKCSQCDHETKMQADLDKHELFVHRKVFHCTFEDCTFKTNNQKYYNEHLEYHKPENVFSCTFEDCYYKAETEQRVLDHLDGFHKISAKHQCPVCSKFFSKKTQLMRHVVSHSNEETYSCQECTQLFMNHTSYCKHRQETGHDQERQEVVGVPLNIQISEHSQITGNEIIGVNEVTGAEGRQGSVPDSIQIHQYADCAGFGVRQVEGRQGIANVQQSIQIHKNNRANDSTWVSEVTGVNQVTGVTEVKGHVENDLQQMSMVMYRDVGVSESHILPTGDNSEKFQRPEDRINPNVQVYNVNEGHAGGFNEGGDIKIDQDTQIIYMNDCDETTKALILQQLQNGYQYHQDCNMAEGPTGTEGVMNVDYTNTEDHTGQFITLSNTEDGNHVIMGGEGQTVVLYDPSLHGAVSGLSTEIPAGFQIVSSSNEGQYDEGVIQGQIAQTQGHGQFEAAHVASSSLADEALVLNVESK